MSLWNKFKYILDKFIKGIAICFCIMFVILVVSCTKFSLENKGDDVAEKTMIEGQELQKINESLKQENLIDITGTLELSIQNDNSIIADFTTNLADGSKVDIGITCSGDKVGHIEKMAIIKNGKARIVFKEPYKCNWSGMVTGLASFDLTSGEDKGEKKERRQSSSIKKLYGTHGENLKGDFIYHKINIEIKTKIIMIESVGVSYN